MPELPEVETLKRSLEKHIIGHKITGYLANRTNIRYELDPDFKSKIINSTIHQLKRRAKYLIVELDNNNSMVFHLGMTGSVTIRNQDYNLKTHDHIVINLITGQRLIFNDPRRFGMAYICANNELEQAKFMQNTGPEPFSNEFTTKYLQNTLKNKNIPIKSAIMDNKIVVGVGNIYASESLFLSKIHPSRPAKSLTEPELELLVKAITAVLANAIKEGGTTIRNFVDGENNSGYFKQKLHVYDKKGCNCSLCGSIIEKTTHAGRSTYFCPNCQK